MASPQAIISDGASLLNAWAFTRDDSAMFAKGLAMEVLVPIFCSINSSMPGMEAQPPASTIWSTLLYWLDEKKNCIERLTCWAIASLKGSSTSCPGGAGRPPGGGAGPAAAEGGPERRWI